MNFQQQVKPIIKSLRKGDLNEVAERSGLSRQTVRDSLNLKTLIGATENQIKVWEITASMLKGRQEDAMKKEVELAKLAEKLK